MEQLNNNFGWYLTLKTIAESGVFNQPNLTPMESAKKANLYEAFNYLAAKSAIQNIQ